MQSSLSPNAVCNWCTHYGQDYRDCDVRSGALIIEPWKPRRCVYYDGPEVNDAALAKLREIGVIE